MTAVVYDLERGPVAADAVDAVLDPQFGQQLADELYVSNADRLPPAALMAEWAVRCVYTDGVPGWAPPATQIDATDKAFWFVQDALQGVQDEDTVHRFLHAVLQFVTHGRRVGRGLWPDVEVRLAQCPRQCRHMRLALAPSDEDGDENLAQCRHQGRELLARARLVLGNG